MADDYNYGTVYPQAFPKAGACAMRGVVSADEWVKNPGTGIDELLTQWRNEHPVMSGSHVYVPTVKARKQRKPKALSSPVKIAAKRGRPSMHTEMTKAELNELRNERRRNERDKAAKRPYRQGKQIDPNFAYDEAGHRVYEISTKPITCVCCGKTKAAAEFPEDRYRPLGHRKICKRCQHNKYLAKKKNKSL